MLTDPNGPSLGQTFPLLPSDLKPSVPVTNEAQYGYALNVSTSPTSLLAAQAHLGSGICNVTCRCKAQTGRIRTNGCGCKLTAATNKFCFSGNQAVLNSLRIDTVHPHIVLVESPASICG